MSYWAWLQFEIYRRPTSVYSEDSIDVNSVRRFTSSEKALVQALQQPTSHGSDNGGQKQGSDGPSHHDKWTWRRNRDWKTGGDGHDEITRLKESLCNMAAENSHRRKRIPEKTSVRDFQSSDKDGDVSLSRISTGDDTYIPYMEYWTLLCINT
jgi:hypothetical protein